MNYDLSKKISLELLKATTAGEVETLVKNHTFFTSVKWIPYGGKSNNKGTIEGQMKEPENALIEKITNSIDAILMRKCLEENITPSDKTKVPPSMKNAVEKYFGSKEKLRKARPKIAKEYLWLIAEGEKERPSITIIDKGEGQQPNKIKETILSLHENIKEKIPFVYGTYNQGGACALGFAAGNPSSYEESYLQLVLCRRPNSIKDQFKEDNYDHFGFTVVRRQFNKEAGAFTYEYFVDKNNNICSFPFTEPIGIHGFRFSEGCVIKLYDYQLKKSGNVVFKGLNVFIEKKCPEIPLPVYLLEKRTGFYKGGLDYSIFGLKERLYRNKNLLKEECPQEIPIDLGPIGKREATVFVIKHKTMTKEKIDSYLEQPEKIFFVRNGLSLHTENINWLKNNCDLPDLGPYLFLFIDISQISPALAQMIHSGRESFRQSANTRLSLERLKIFLSSETFRELNKEYAKLTISDTSVDDREVRKQLAKDIEADPELKKMFALGEDVPADDDNGSKEEQPYKGEYLPTQFVLLGDSPRIIEKGSFAKVTFQTNAEERLFERENDQGKYDWSESKKFHITYYSFKRGKLVFRVDHNPSLVLEEEETINFYLKVPSKNLSFSQAIKFILKEKPLYQGNYFPTFFKPTKQKMLVPVNESRRIVLLTDADNDYLSRINDRGTVILPERADIEFGSPRLKDGKMKVRVKFLSETIGPISDIRITISDSNNSFDISVGAEVVPQGSDTELKLPTIEPITREEWNNDTPPWDENEIARIPSWKELTAIKLNMDSKPFNELQAITLIDKDKARDMLISHIMINCIWLFLEFKDIDKDIESNGDTDKREKIFKKAIRASSRYILQNIKKQLR